MKSIPLDNACYGIYITQTFSALHKIKRPASVMATIKVKIYRNGKFCIQRLGLPVAASAISRA